MSKKISVALALLTFVYLVAGGFSCHRAMPKLRARSPARNAAIISTTAAVLKETSELRELTILREVKSGAQSRQDIEKMIMKNLDADTTPIMRRCTPLKFLLKAFGLAPKSLSIGPF